MTQTPGRSLLIPLLLARHTQAHAGHRQLPRLGNRFIAFFAVTQARPARQLGAGALDRVLDAVVDLLLHGAVAGPSSGHVDPSPQLAPA